MNLPSTSPNEKKHTPASIKPMPASRAERSSEVVEILERRLIFDWYTSS